MLLTVTTFLPLFGALLCLLLPREEEGLLRGFAFTVALLTFGVSLFMLGDFDPTKWNHLVDKEWVAAFGIHFKLAVDGISLWLVLLTTFLMPIVLCASWSSIEKKTREFVVAMLILETGMIGTFLATDLFVFYTFWEVMLIPMYFIIGIWGGDRKLYAAIKFVLYTMVGSLLMIVAIIYLYIRNHDATGIWTFDYDTLLKVVLSPREQLFCFGAFALAFCIKVPLFPFHTWLPDAHTDAPTAGSVILAAVMLKMGTYGFLRFSLPILPDASRTFVPMMVILSIIGIVYGALVALAQKDWKRLVAYSSVAHMAMVMLGMFALNPVGITGSIIQQLNHGISTGALFLLVGVVYERRHTREISEYGGLSKVMPVYAAVFLVMTMSSIGLPTLNGFIGELMILQGVFVANKVWAAFAASGVVLGAAYMLYLYQRTMFGKVENVKNENLPDLSLREFATFAPLLALALWIGLYPSPFINRIQTSVQHVIARVSPEYANDKLAGNCDTTPKPEQIAANTASQFLAAAPCGPDGQPLPAATTGAR